MRLYKSHKVVAAAVIVSVIADEECKKMPQYVLDDGDTVAHPQGTNYVPKVGDYYVVYEDSYASLSPKAAFENGYTEYVVEQPTAPEYPCLPLPSLRSANRARLPQFKDAHGRPAHSMPDGSDWSLNDWYTAVSGEVGELGNVLKKVRRGDITLDEARESIGKELADVLTYLDLLAFRCGVDLSAATIAKFNEVSERVGADVRISAQGGVYRAEASEPELPLYEKDRGCQGKCGECNCGGAQPTTHEENFWSCKIGGFDITLPPGADAPMRRAVEDAYSALTGKAVDYCASGWGGKLTEDERAAYEEAERSLQP